MQLSVHGLIKMTVECQRGPLDTRNNQKVAKKNSLVLD